MSNNAKAWDVDAATKLGKAVVTGVKTYGQAAGLAAFVATNVDAHKHLLEAAIDVCYSVKDEKVRKSAFDVWTRTLSRVTNADESHVLSYKRGDGAVTVAWKVKAPKKAKDEGTSEGGDEGDNAPKAEGLTDDALLALVKARMQASEAFAERMMEELTALVG